MAEGIRNPDLIRKKERQIALAAAKCFTVNGFNQTTVREIAKASGLTIGNLYDYIKTKEDTLYLLYKEIYWEWTESVVSDETLLQIEDPKGQLIAAVERMLDIYDKSRDLMILAIREAKFLQRHHLRAVLEQESKLVDYFADIIRRGIEAGLFRKVDAVLAANSIILHFALIPLRGWSIRKNCDEGDVKQFSVDFIVNGFLAH
ncbi:MAG: TetR/AcrR family transcriptional regulator [Deltaproteobacteria bacterium]|nr:TetR/AcrR family transcriptional regulator [Deltaproteobacteria bacterium]